VNALGSITIREEVYTLTDAGAWTGPNANTVEILNGSFPPARYERGSSAVLPAGFETVRAAARYYRDQNPTLPAFSASDEPPDTVH
jgi:hypothetical protein